MRECIKGENCCVLPAACRVAWKLLRWLLERLLCWLARIDMITRFSTRASLRGVSGDTMTVSSHSGHPTRGCIPGGWVWGLRRVERGLIWLMAYALGARDQELVRVEMLILELISQKVFIKSFRKSQFPHKSVNFFFI